MRILLIRLSSLGDIQLATAAAGLIRRARPDARVDMAVYSQFLPLIAERPDLDRKLAVPKRETGCALARLRFFRSLGLCLRFRRELRRERYDHVIDLHNVTDSALVALAARTASRCGNRRQLLTLFFSRRLRLDDRNETAEIHASLLAMQAVSLSGAIGDTPLPAIPQTTFHFSPRQQEAAAAFLERHGLNGKLLCGINPAASAAWKRWPAERFAAVAEFAGWHWNLPVLLFGSPSERPLLEEIAGRLTMPPILVCEEDMMVSFAILARVGIYVTADSGPMHVAAALDIPHVAIFGPSSFRKFFPLSRHARVVRQPVPCAPCPPARGRKCALRSCMHGIATEAVLFELGRLVADEYPQLGCQCQTRTGDTHP